MTHRRKDAVEMVREIRAAPEQVFRALTEPEELMKWWGSEGLMTEAKTNLRPGGEYRFDYRTSEGEAIWVKGQYQVVEPPRRIVKTWFCSKFPDLRNTVEFRLERIAAGTRLTLIHSGLGGRPEAFDDYEKGWPEVLGYLALWAVAFAAYVTASGPDNSEG